MTTIRRQNLSMVYAVTACIILIILLDTVVLRDGDIKNSRTYRASKMLATSDGYSTTSVTSSEDVAIIKLQLRLQNEFQELIRINQNPTDCQKRRILMTGSRPIAADGFCIELQVIGRHLQAGMALDRSFVIRNNFESAYAPPECQWSFVNMTAKNKWDCLYEPVSNCTEDAAQGGDVLNVNATLMAAYGIHNHDQSAFFHSGYYGNHRVVEGLNFNPKKTWSHHVDIIEYWERTMGRFWIRSQMVHYLWRPSVGLQSEMQPRLPRQLLDSQTKFIGMHIRFTDNIGSLWNDFGRNANVTRSLHHFMMIAQDIRNQTGISTIYLATDSSTILKAVQDASYPGWSFVVQQNVIRSSETKWIWFRESRGSSAAAVATDIEVLRRADYLIGSYQSNVYRLVTELNSAFHVGNYPLHVDRHRPVDVPWYEDP